MTSNILGLMADARYKLQYAYPWELRLGGKGIRFDVSQSSQRLQLPGSVEQDGPFITFANNTSGVVLVAAGDNTIVAAADCWPVFPGKEVVTIHPDAAWLAVIGDVGVGGAFWAHRGFGN